jgi:hypothetical protein
MKYALILPLLLLDILMIILSIPMFGLLYFILVDKGQAPFVLRLYR